MGVLYDFDCIVAADESEILPGGDDGVLGHKVLGADHGLAHVPLDPLAHLDAALVVTSR